MMNVNKGSVPLELNLTNTPSAPNFMANPHGISTWKDEKTGSVLPAKSDSDDMFCLQIYWGHRIDRSLLSCQARVTVT